MRLLPLLAGLGAVLACSSSASPVAPTVFTPCLSSGLATGWQAQCAACVQASCATQGQAFEAQCGDYLSCVCGDAEAADEDGSAVAKCASNLSEPDCKQALGSLETCQSDKCLSPCLGPDGGTEAAVPLGDATLDGEGGPATVTFSCSNGVGTATECDQQQIPVSAAQAAMQGCTQVGGTTGTGCPVLGVVGCCTLPTTENCYYDPSAGAQRQATCVSAGGTWSTSP